ncbi:hypothetical protein Bbelb_391960 [Branchiostoma belcheri]|nr:hypothetical protein Bbelb_391960 [Branchiostoma belcheri]
MDLTVCQQLEKLVEELTTSGQHQLDKATVKTLKKICKTSDDYVKHTYHLLNMQLQKDHAEIRLSAFQTMDELFQRSHAFRELLIAEFQEFLELTVESNYDFPLPPPKAAADKLKKQTLQAIQRWHEQFGQAYKKLTLGYNFLRYNRKIDFSNIAASSNVERTRQEQEAARIQAIKLQRAKNALKEMEETKPEIDECLTQAESCFQLLVPRNDAMDSKITPPRNGNQDTSNTLPTTSHGGRQIRKQLDGDDLSCDSVSCKSHIVRTKEQARARQLPAGEGSLVSGDGKKECINNGRDSNTPPGDGQEGDSDEESDDDVEVEEDVVRHHGLGSHKYNISIEFNPDDSGIREDTDNADIMDTLRDMNKLIVGRFLPAVGRWLEVFSKAGIEQREVKKAIDIKQALTAALQKCAELGIHTEQKTDKQQRKDSQDDSSDDDFVEVEEKEGYEPRIPDELRAEYGLEPAKPKTKTKPSATKPRTVPAASTATTSGTKPPTKKSWHPFLSEDNNPSDPTSYSAALSTLQPSQENRGEKRKVSFDAQPSTSGTSSSKTDLLSKAPVVPFGMDLYTWGEKAKNLQLDQSLHRFWRPSDEGEIEVNRVDPSRERTITFAGEFEPVKWTCKAPLSNGKLCPRMDRYKCPFHGPIIPRDETGKPSNPADAEREERRRREQQLEDLKKVKNTTRRRLERKVFNSGSVKRVAAEMNKLDQRRYNDKFGNQFNYALN